ncbi:MAG: YccF domain-containing protein [Polyangiaceae bacterium]|nr:YccF domain-containing protein [Polyangiaceae bacterium]
MGTLGNILWVVLGGGFPLFLGYLVAGAALAITIVGFPFAVATWRLGRYALLPFNNRVEDRKDSLGSGCLGFLFNVIWLVVFGWGFAIAHLGSALLCAITIIGIPFAVAHFKLAILALWPFGKEIV